MTKKPKKLTTTCSNDYLHVSVAIYSYSFLSFLSFLLEIEGSELSRKVREAIPVHLVLVWSGSDVMVPSYGQIIAFMGRLL